MDWTHKDIEITDIRRLKKLYIITVDDDEIEESMLIDSEIFDERLRSFFLKSPNDVSRFEIMSQKWNMYLTKGYYVKPGISSSELKKHFQSSERWYVSFLEIAGPLGSFDIIVSKSIKINN